MKAVRGTQDLFGEKLVYWHLVEKTVRDVLPSFGYEEIRTPILEYKETFSQTVGDATDIVEKQMYEIAPRKTEEESSERIVLRPEGTASFIRSVVEHQLQSSGHIARYFYSEPMFRYERPQKGRLRQFHQVGAELINDSSAEADAELITLLHSFFGQLGIKEYEIRINSLGTSKTRQAFKEALQKYFRPHSQKLHETDQKKLERAPIRILDSNDEKIRPLIEAAPSILDFLDPESRQHFELLQKRLTQLEVPFRVDPLLVRGLDYYTQTAFEFNSPLLGAQSALGGGGRYDDLASRFGASPFPSVGWALGVERVILVLEQLKKEASLRRPVFYFAPLTPEAFEFFFPISIQLKKSGIWVELPYERDKKIKWYLKQANRIEAKYAVLLGEDEWKTKKALVKNMQTSEQSEVEINQLQNWCLEQGNK